MDDPAPTRARELLSLVVPAALVGVGSALVLFSISAAASGLTDLVWSDLTDALGVDPDEPWWIVLVLSGAGVLAGLVIAFVPGNGGPDPATVSLVDRPLPIGVLPGLLLAVMITLVGGVSLGPENPVMAVNAALCVALGSRLLPVVPPPVWVGLAAAGTIGALFGTPVAAALMLSESMTGDATRSLWDRLFAPLVAAGCGAGAMHLLADGDLALDVGDYPGFTAGDVAWAGGVATATAAVGLVMIHLFPLVHGLLRRAARPALVPVIGGVVLGVLGAIGGRETLFKGSEEMQVLATNLGDHTGWGLTLVVVVKCLALLVAASSGFAGGRIFPAVFIGVVTGLAIHAAVPSVSLSLTVSAATVGILAATTRSGWISIFTALAVVPDLDLVPVLVLAILPAWLLVTGRPTMTIGPGPGA
ncbi:MAG: ion channel protein [Aeromicrobium sp.]